MQDAPQKLRRLFDAAVAACHPSRVVAPALPRRPGGKRRIVVVGAGKASAAMAAAVEDAWGPPLSGQVVTRYGHGVSTKYVEVVEAGHPLPDGASERAARRALELVSGLKYDDFVLALLSGGGSALWSAPLAPLTLAEKQKMTRALVLSGASIAEINCVRKQLSAIKGGRLAAAAYPAYVLTLAISDVVGDDPTVIASGPGVGDTTTQADARAILAKYKIVTPAHATQILANPELESLGPNRGGLDHNGFRLVARSADAMAAAADAAQAMGFETKMMGLNLAGDARRMGRVQAEIVRDTVRGSRPLVFLSGGELTMRVTGSGRGGPNREFLLAFVQALQGMDGVWAFAADTDGIDGNDDAAGAWTTPDTLARARTLGLDAKAYAENNDAGTFFARLGQAVVTGPTRTNVNDFRAILIAPAV